MAFPRTLADLIDVAVACDPERTAVIDRHGEWSYAVLDRRASQLANGLIAHGVRPGQRVAVLIGNESRFVEALLGTWRAGAVAVLANTRLTPGQVADQVADSQACVVLASAELADAAAAVAARAEGTRIFLGDEYDAWRQAQPTARPTVEVTPDEVGMQPYTSGSTGKPKGVLLTHRGQLHNARVVGQVDMIAEDERALVSAPIFHANAMASAVLPFLLVGGSLVILPRFEVEEVAAAIARHRCTFMTGVPSMYSALLNAGAFSRHDVSSLRFVACGSAPVTRELLEQLESVVPGVIVMEGYGLTEAGPVVTESPRFGVRRLGSIGLPLPGVQVRLRRMGGERVDGEDAYVGEVGEILVRSPGVAIGYHGNPEQFAARVTTDGWLRTGDLAHADADGFLYFHGRMDDMMNVGGENVYPQTVEALIRQYPGVADVAVVPSSHATKGQVPVAFVVAEPAATVDPEQIRQFCLENGPAFAHPRRVVVVDQLPVSAIGKLDRKRLTVMAAADAAVT
jgi:acyl-CoA synthetase (AMP-forming)/AMP-acid ligase II